MKIVTAEPRRATPNYLARAAFVAARAKSERRAAEEVAAELFPKDRVTPSILTRSPAPIASTGTANFLQELVDGAVTEFLGGITAASAAAVLMQASPMRLDVTRKARLVPVRPGGPAAPGWSPEGDPIGVRGDSLDVVPLGPTRKIAAIAVATRESLKYADAERIFAVALTEDAGLGLDAAVFSDEDGSGDAIAGLLDGATEVAGTSDPHRDLKALASAVSAGGSGRVTFIAGPGTAAALGIDSTIRATILPSLAVAETRLIAVDPVSVAWGAGPDPDISASSVAAIHMDTAAAEIVAGNGTVASNVRSLFQTDSIATRVILDVAFVKRRAAACAFVDGVDYVS